MKLTTASHKNADAPAASTEKTRASDMISDTEMATLRIVKEYLMLIFMRRFKHASTMDRRKYCRSDVARQWNTSGPRDLGSMMNQSHDTARKQQQHAIKKSIRLGFAYFHHCPLTSSVGGVLGCSVFNFFGGFVMVVLREDGAVIFFKGGVGVEGEGMIPALKF
jgi:hypothetical protein